MDYEIPESVKGFQKDVRDHLLNQTRKDMTPEALAQLSSALRHDILGPLGVVLGYTDMVLEDVPPEVLSSPLLAEENLTVKDICMIIRDSSYRIMILVNEYNEFIAKNRRLHN